MKSRLDFGEPINLEWFLSLFVELRELRDEAPAWPIADKAAAAKRDRLIEVIDEMNLLIRTPMATYRASLDDAEGGLGSPAKTIPKVGLPLM